MKTFIPLFCSLVLTASAVAAPLHSPSGKFTVTTEISGEEAGPTRRFCVKLVVVEEATHQEIRLNTGASDAQKWALAWSPANSLVLYSADIGTLVYDIRDGKLIERPADQKETDLGHEAYRMKYDRKPNVH